MKARRLVLSVLGCAAISMAAAPSAQAATIFDFLPPEIASLIPSGSADAVNPLLPPTPAAPAAPAPAPQVAPAPQAPAPRAGYKNCTEARNAGVTPIYRGQDGYAPHLDRDNDGIACE
ncbi:MULTISPECIES: excalibur calcium-binding domain-containing protein [unclassified Rhodococcus (in: high G+C Gram-positive bacteria)]|uniref:excalibur calcium-binding domain-containing protein n=1 Tax=unclassified Rhodococcus (in: high G+C Gram-positive bacteria) TaxID=192944 RepID=UPI00036D506C|nr:excalibur calcium-binding domain-containing protein [Rhodococcus sp. DK17]